MSSTKLGELTDLISSGSTPLGGERVYLKQGPVAFIRSQNVRMNELDFQDVAFIPESINSEMRRTQLKFNDVLLNITGASIGRVAVFDRPGVRANVNQHVCIVRPDHKKLFSRYLAKYLATARVQAEIQRIQNGGTRQALTFSQIAEFSIPAPPLEEQKRIAAILDKADAIRRKREQAIKLADEFLRSLFLDMFGDPVRNPKGFLYVPLSSLTKVTSGSTPSRDDPANYGGTIPWVKTTEVNGGVITDTEEKVTTRGAQSARLKSIPPGAILIAMYGQGKTRGRCALLNIQATTNQACAVLWPSEVFDPSFMFVQLTGAYERLRSLGQGGNQPNLNLDLVGSFHVLNPPLHLQCRFAAAAAKVSSMRAKTTWAQLRCQQMASGLAGSAFRGEL